MFTSLFYYVKSLRLGFYILLIILFVVYSVSNNERRNDVLKLSVKTDKGIIYVNEQAAPAINQVIKYIDKNTSITDRILVLPEGAMINFLTNRLSDNKYFHLSPANIDVLGEDNIVKDLENYLPDYIVLQPMSYNNFGHTYFCESFGIKICNLLPKYYQTPVVFGENFWIAVYKRKGIK